MNGAQDTYAMKANSLSKTRVFTTASKTPTTNARRYEILKYHLSSISKSWSHSVEEIKATTKTFEANHHNIIINPSLKHT